MMFRTENFSFFRLPPRRIKDPEFSAARQQRTQESSTNDSLRLGTFYGRWLPRELSNPHRRSRIICKSLV